MPRIVTLRIRQGRNATETRTPPCSVKHAHVKHAHAAAQRPRKPRRADSECAQSSKRLRVREATPRQAAPRRAESSCATP